MKSLKLATPSRTMSSMSSRPAVAQIGDDHVQAVIDAGFALGLFPPGVERVAHARAFGLDGEIDDGGGAAEGRRARAGFEIVGGRGAAEGHVEVGVDVDAAGHHQHAGGVDDGRRTRRNAGAMSLMRSPSIRTSAAIGVPRGDQGAVADERVVLIKGGLPRVTLLPALNGRPVSTCSIVMQFSTGQTSQQRLQPTHSASSTLRNAGGGVWPLPAYAAASSLAMGVTVMARLAIRARPAWRGRRCGCTGARHPSRRVAESQPMHFSSIDARDDLVS
jgi:hypothetical protein